MTRLWTPNRPPIYMAPYGALVGACRPKMQQPAAAPSSLLTDLVAYYKLEEASGTRVDATSRGNDLTDNNTVGQAAGKVGNAASFVAANSESLSILDNADLSMADIDFTVAAWAYLDSKPTVGAIVSKSPSAGSDNYYEYTLIYLGGATDRFRIMVGNGSANSKAVADSLGAPSTATWYFLVGWHDSVADTVNIQANNGVVDSVAYAGGSYDAAGTFGVGYDTAAGAWAFDGRIDEVGIWKRVLTAAERTALYNGGSGITHPFTGT